MEVLRNLLVNVAADSNPLADLNREMRQMNDLTNSGSSELRDMNKETGLLGKTMKGAAIGVAAIGSAAVGAVAAVAKIGPELVKSAASASAMTAQFKSVFGDTQKEAQNLIKSLGKDFGMAPNRIKPAITQMTAMFKGLGLDTKDAMETASSAVTLTADAAAFYDKSFEDANSALNSFIKGNYEGGESIGLFANETQLAAYAAKNGVAKFADLGEAQKQLMRMEYAKEMQKSAGATGQAARESNSLENQLGNLRSSWEDLKVKFGTPILDPAIKSLSTLATWLQEINTDPAVAALSSFSSSAENAGKKVYAVATGLSGLFSGTSSGMVDFQSKVTKAFGQESGLKVITFFMTIRDGVDLAEKYLGKARGLFEGVVAAFQGNTGKSAGILSALGFSPETILQVQSVVSQIVDEVKFRFDVLKTVAKGVGKFFIAAFNYLAPIIIPAVQEVLTFVGGIFGKIRAFWESDGQQLMKAVSNLFKGIFTVVDFVMPAVLFIVKMVWNNIKGVINGALDIILGAVKVFSGLFTGDFGKMWEGLKQMFFGAVQFLWNFVQLMFYGKILSGAKAFILNFRTAFAGLWTAVQKAAMNFGNAFTQFLQGNLARAAQWARIGLQRIVTGFKEAFSAIWKNISDASRAIWTFLKETWSSIGSMLRGALDLIKLIFSKGLSFIFSTTTRIFGGMWSFIVQTVSKIFNSIKAAWGWIRNSTSTTFGQIVNTVKTRFNNIVEAAKNLPGRIGQGIGSMASKVKSGLTKVINTMASVLGKGVNGVIGGVNWVLGKVGIGEGSFVDLWPIPQWANGTKNGAHPGGPAMINDGKGSNAGKELIRTPDGRMGMFSGKNIIANLPKGTQVLSATDTRGYLGDIPKYDGGTAKDTGFFSKAKDFVFNKASDLYNGAKNIGGKVMDAAFNVFDYIKSPGKLLDLAMKSLGFGAPEGGTAIGDMAKGAFNKVKAGAINFVKGKLDTFASTSGGVSLTGGNGGGFGAPFRLTSRPGPRNTGILGASRMHKGWDWAAPIGTPIPSVSNGVVTRNSWHPLSGKFVEVTSGNKIHRYQHNSRNAVSVGQQVAKGQTVGYVGNTGVSSGPHLHYEVKKGFARGTNGPLKKATTAWVGERGPELMRLNQGTEVFSHNESKSIDNRGYMPGAATSGGGMPFSPEVNIYIQGNPDESVIENMKNAVRKELEEQYERFIRQMGFSKEG